MSIKTICSSSKIKGKVYKNGAEPDPVEAPFKVKIEPLDNKWVDISPYYTDFYVAGNNKYQTVNAFKDIGSGLKTLVGGELGNYNEMMIKARTIATDRMIKEADDLGADAVVGLRYSTSSIMQSAAEVMAYGTAVKYI